MKKVDLNLLFTLEALLAEGSVVGAAQRLHLSPSAMSRALARLRATTGDPLLVRAGRGLVATPRALELREQVGHLVQEASAVLRPVKELDLRQLFRTFTLRTRHGFMENFGPELVALISVEAPGVKLCFLHKTNKDSSPLRNGSVDLEIGVVGKTTAPELRVQALYRDRFIGVVREGHPLNRSKTILADYAAGKHIAVSKPSHGKGLIDETFSQLGLKPEIVTIVGGFSTALTFARSSDLIATVPERHTGKLRQGMHSFPLPFTSPEITVSLLWHPRMDADPAHRWLRGCIRDVCMK